MTPHRITLFAGHYGSGKTNIALSYARWLKRTLPTPDGAAPRVTIADLDIVNPYFRTKDSAEELAREGIGLVVSDFANSNVDFPALPAEIYSVVADRDAYAVLDIGGDDRGALALGRYVDDIRAGGDYEMLAVVNAARPLTATVEDTLAVLREIEATSRLPFTGVVNNTNLGPATTAEDVVASLDYARAVAGAAGLPLRMTCCREDLLARVTELAPGEVFFPLAIQRLYYQLDAAPAVAPERRTTLLHVCCGPCASACVPALEGQNRRVTLFFANSNIDTREEYERRLAEARRLAAHDGVELVASPYDHDEWLREVAAGCEYEPEKGARCERCFRYNLAKAAQYANAHGFDEFTTSLTVSPHKVSSLIFAAGREAETGAAEAKARFLPADFKRRGGYELSVKRATELGLYRQNYCGCEFSKERWTIHAKAETVSTNLDAREGRHREVFVADYQTGGRGRLDHVWESPRGENLTFSAVLSVAGLKPEHVATFPLVAGLAVARAVQSVLKGAVARLKWPNDVLVDGRKIAGILCERLDDRLIVGIGINVGQTEFSPELADKATSLAIVADGSGSAIRKKAVMGVVLAQLAKWHGIWRDRGFEAVYPEIAALDMLRARRVSVKQLDDDAAPVEGVSGGVCADGSLDVGGERVYAGEAHVEEIK